MGAKLLYRSWPAVSQISNFTTSFSGSSTIVSVKNAAPMVGSWKEWNSFRTNCVTKHDFPTAESPRLFSEDHVSVVSVHSYIIVVVNWRGGNDEEASSLVGMYSQHNLEICAELLLLFWVLINHD